MADSSVAHAALFDLCCLRGGADPRWACAAWGMYAGRRVAQGIWSAPEAMRWLEGNMGRIAGMPLGGPESRPEGTIDDALDQVPTSEDSTRNTATEGPRGRRLA